jgi:hypothetical protein
MDGANPGFGVRINPGGGKTWIYRYRFEGCLTRMALGDVADVTLADARTAYNAARAAHHVERVETLG